MTERPLSYRNQSIDLQSKFYMFLHDKDLVYERINGVSFVNTRFNEMFHSLSI